MDGTVAVIGAGTMGSMIAWRSALRTAGVVAFDTASPGSENTAVGGDTRLFRMAYAEGPHFAALLEESERLWLELNISGGREVLNQCGGLTIGDADNDHMRSLFASVRDTRTAHEQLTHRQLSERYPAHRLFPEDVGVFDPRGGFIRTDAAVFGALQQAQYHGATVVTDTKIDRIVPGPGFVTIWSGSTSWNFKTVVISSGAWAKDLLPAVYAPEVEPRRLQMNWFAARNPADFEPDVFPPFMRESRDIHTYGAPTIDGSTVKVAGATQSHAIAHADQIQHDLSLNEIRAANAMTADTIEGLIPSCVRSRAYPELYSHDGMPLVGWIPEMSGVYVATGFTGGGFKMASGVGEAVARDLAGEQSSTVGFASPTRFIAART